MADDDTDGQELQTAAQLPPPPDDLDDSSAGRQSFPLESILAATAAADVGGSGAGSGAGSGSRGNVLVALGPTLGPLLNRSHDHHGAAGDDDDENDADTSSSSGEDDDDDGGGGSGAGGYGTMTINDGDGVAGAGVGGDAAPGTGTTEASALLGGGGGSSGGLRDASSGAPAAAQKQPGWLARTWQAWFGEEEETPHPATGATAAMTRDSLLAAAEQTGLGGDAYTALVHRERGKAGLTAQPQLKLGHDVLDPTTKTFTRPLDWGDHRQLATPEAALERPPEPTIELVVEGVANLPSLCTYNCLWVAGQQVLDPRDPAERRQLWGYYLNPKRYVDRVPIDPALTAEQQTQLRNGKQVVPPLTSAQQTHLRLIQEDKALPAGSLAGMHQWLRVTHNSLVHKPRLIRAGYAVVLLERHEAKQAAMQALPVSDEAKACHTENAAAWEALLEAGRALCAPLPAEHPSRLVLTRLLPNPECVELYYLLHTLSTPHAQALQTIFEVQRQLVAYWCVAFNIHDVPDNLAYGRDMIRKLFPLQEEDGTWSDADPAKPALLTPLFQAMSQLLGYTDDSPLALPGDGTPNLLRDRCLLLIWEQMWEALEVIQQRMLQEQIPEAVVASITKPLERLLFSPEDDRLFFQNQDPDHALTLWRNHVSTHAQQAIDLGERQSALKALFSKIRRWDKWGKRILLPCLCLLILAIVVVVIMAYFSNLVDISFGNGGGGGDSDDSSFAAPSESPFMQAPGADGRRLPHRAWKGDF